MSFNPELNSSFSRARNNLLAEATTLKNVLTRLKLRSPEPILISSLDSLERILKVLFTAVPLRLVPIRYWDLSGQRPDLREVVDTEPFPLPAAPGQRDLTKEWLFAVRMIGKTFEDASRQWRSFAKATDDQAAVRAVAGQWTAVETAYSAWRILGQALEESLRMNVGESHFQNLVSQFQDATIREATMRSAWSHNEADQDHLVRWHRAHGSDRTPTVLPTDTSASWVGHSARFTNAASATSLLPTTSRSVGATSRERLTNRDGDRKLAHPRLRY